MQSITGEVHGLRCLGFVEPGENVFHSVEQVRTYPATVSTLIKPFEASMLEAPYHRAGKLSVKCTLSLVNLVVAELINYQFKHVSFEERRQR
jgi:hypothetical protein